MATAERATTSTRRPTNRFLSRGSELTLREHQARISSAVRISCAAISLLTRRRFSARHDELLYVIRKPQYSFARVV